MNALRPASVVVRPPDAEVLVRELPVPDGTGAERAAGLTQRSLLTGRRQTRRIPVDPDRLAAWLADPNPPHIQLAFPELSADDSEFVLNGTTPEEWTELFGELD